MKKALPGGRRKSKVNGMRGGDNPQKIEMHI